jgi:hypothetical protein
MVKRTADVEPDIDALFQLPLTEFTSSRNALAARLKKEGRAEEAETIKGMQKPPVSAWAVNQLAWRHRKDVDNLLAVGERFRKAQAAQLAGKAADMHALLNERRDALSALMKEAAVILRDSGHSPSPDTTRRIATTLEALAAWGDTPGQGQVSRGSGCRPRESTRGAHRSREGPARSAARGGTRRGGAQESRRAREGGAEGERRDRRALREGAGRVAGSIKGSAQGGGERRRSGAGGDRRRARSRARAQGGRRD